MRIIDKIKGGIGESASYFYYFKVGGACQYYIPDSPKPIIIAALGGGLLLASFRVGFRRPQ